MIASHTFVRTAHAPPAHRSRLVMAGASTALVAGLSLALAVTSGPAQAAATDIGLGAAADYAVLAGTGVTNTGSTTITTEDASLNGDVGTSNASESGTITGSGGISWVLPATGSLHVNDANAALAQADNLLAYGVAAGAPSEFGLGGQLDGAILKPGVHTASSALDLAVDGTVTLDADGDSDAVFVIQVGSSLTLNSNSTVSLIDGADPCHVFWQVSEDATIGTDAHFEGTMLAENMISANMDAEIVGRLLAQNAAVTLDSNDFIVPVCATATTPPPTTATPGPTATTPAPSATTPTAKPTPKPTNKSGPGNGNGNGSSDDDDSDGGSGGSTDGGSSGGGTSGGSDGDADGSTTSTSTGIPNTGGPPAFLVPAGAVAVLAGAVLMITSRRPRGTHRA